MVPASVDTILARLSEQQVILKQQKHALSSGKDGGAHIPKQDSSPSSMVLTPGSDKSLSHSQQVNAKAGNEFRTQLDLIEMVRLKEELDAAKNQIALQKQELDQTRVLKHTQEPTMVSSSSADLNSQGDISADKGTVNTIDRHTEARQDRFTHNDDARSDFSDTFSTGVINNTGQSIWTAPPKPAFNVGMTAASNQHFQQPASSWGQPGARPWNHRAIGTGVPQIVLPQQQMQQMQQRTYSGPASTISSSDGGVISDYNNFPTAVGGRRSNNHNTRNASLFSQNRGNGWDLYAGGVQGLNATSMAMDPTSAFQSVGMYPSSIQYQPRPIGTPLSPTAEEFRATQPSNNPWNVAVKYCVHSRYYAC